MINNNYLTIQSAPVVEIFDSIQGEGKYVGAKQIFVRLAGCPLACEYCDTSHVAEGTFEVAGTVYDNPVDAVTLYKILYKHFLFHNYHSISFTGGEPLLYPAFLHEFAKTAPAKLFLETSGYDPAGILNIAPYFDYISVDLKINIEPFGLHADKLLSAMGLLPPEKMYIKMVLRPDTNADNAVSIAAPLFEKYNIKEVWLQPVDNLYDPEKTARWQGILNTHGVDARFVPQIHKLLNIR